MEFQRFRLYDSFQENFILHVGFPNLGEAILYLYRKVHWKLRQFFKVFDTKLSKWVVWKEVLLN